MYKHLLVIIAAAFVFNGSSCGPSASDSSGNNGTPIEGFDLYPVIESYDNGNILDQPAWGVGVAGEMEPGSDTSESLGTTEDFTGTARVSDAIYACLYCRNAAQWKFLQTNGPCGTTNWNDASWRWVPLNYSNAQTTMVERCLDDPPNLSGSELTSDQYLYPSQAIYSPDGVFELAYQSDGNLVIYQTPCCGSPIWAIGQTGYSAGSTIMQEDGNFVVYDNDGNAMWATGTQGNPGAYAQIVNNGDLVVFSSGGAQLWSSGP